MSAIIGRDKEVDELKQLVQSQRAEFAVRTDYHKKLVHRTNVLQPYLSRKMVIHSTLVTTFGLTYNQYSGDFVNVVTLDDMFI